ncbi:MAG: hypothetical protein LBP59_09725 [Planctomycetaceae bacterium]|jgi:hypothetical protein|nr:hypothetical protein [Planctomycetaceae bacterium]
MRNITKIIFVFASCFLFAFAGCSSSNPQNRQAIEGEVTINGNPVASGNIEFEPSGDQKERTQSGALITKGRYSIPAPKGLVGGDYKVRISVMEEVPGSRVENPDPMKSTVEYRNIAPPEFSDKTTQKITVEAGKKNKFDFKM